MKYLFRVINFLKRKPAPAFLVSIFLSIRWRCRVSLHADISYPFNLKIGRGANIGRCLIIATGEGVQIANNVSIGYGAIIDALGGFISIGENSSIGPLVVIYGEGGVRIGRYNMTAAHAIIVASNHLYSDRETPIKQQGTVASGITIEEDVWIGANVVIQDGVLLERGMIVGSGAVVRSSYRAYSVVAGVPAKIITTR